MYIRIAHFIMMPSNKAPDLRLDDYLKNVHLVTCTRNPKELF